MQKHTRHADSVSGHDSEGPTTPHGSSHSGTTGYADGCPVCVAAIKAERDDTPEPGEEILWQDQEEELSSESGLSESRR